MKAGQCVGWRESQPRSHAVALVWLLFLVFVVLDVYLMWAIYQVKSAC